MHEEALVRDLRAKVDELSRANGGAAIVRARVALGPLSHLDEPRLKELWPRAMAGGPAARAVLEVELIPSMDDPHAASVVLRSVTFSDVRPGGPPGEGTGAPPSSSPSRR